MEWMFAVCVVPSAQTSVAFRSQLDKELAQAQVVVLAGLRRDSRYLAGID